MQLTFYSDYSLRILMYLALRRPERVRVSEIAKRFDISLNHLLKVVPNLAQAGFITSHRGKRGGIELARSPEEINIGELVRYTEGPLRLVECFDPAKNRCVISLACGLAPILQEACDSFLATLDRYTLADLIAKRARLIRLLSIRNGLASASNSRQRSRQASG